MKKIIFCLCLFTFVSARAATLTVTPPHLAWNDNQWVVGEIAGLTPGEAVVLELYLDVNADGQLDAGDLLIRSFPLQDGAQNSFGSRAIPDDRDGEINGIITARIPYFEALAEGIPWYGVGTYLWRVTGSSSGDALAPFAITAPANPDSWITGTVQDTDGNPVPGAQIIAERFAMHRGVLPGVYTDTNGVFRLNIPVGYPLDNLAGLSARVPGALMADEFEDQPFSMWIFEADPVAGANALPIPLRVLLDNGLLPEGVFRVSGQVIDGNGQPIPGMWMEMEHEDDNAHSLAVTDSNGQFTMLLPGGEAELFLSPLVCNQRGLVTFWDDYLIEADLIDLEIQCLPGERLVKILVRDANTLAPLPGVSVEMEGDDTGGFAMTLDDGVVDIVVLAGTYSAEVDDMELHPLGYVEPAEIEDIEVAAGGSPLEGIVFDVEPGDIISGTVSNQQGDPLAFGEVVALWPNSWIFVADTIANRGGYYELLLYPGTYRLLAVDFDGYLEQAFGGYYIWESGINGPSGTPVESPAADIDFALEPGAFIRGRLTNADDDPVRGRVRALVLQQDEDGDYWASAWQAPNDPDSGEYELMVSTSMTYIVQAEADGYLSALYDGILLFQPDQATLVTPSIDQPAEDINFVMEPPRWIEGRVVSGETPLEHVEVQVVRLNDPTVWWDNIWVDTATTDENGFYAVPVPPGTQYAVYAQPPSDTFYVPVWWENSLVGEQLTLITVPDDEDVTGIDFDLILGGRISGNLYTVDGNPYEYFNGYIVALTTNGEWVTTANIEGASYHMLLPPGKYMVQFNDDESVAQFYEDIPAWQPELATVLDVTAGSSMAYVDYQAIASVHVHGLVTLGGVPLSDVLIVAEWVPDSENLLDVIHVTGVRTGPDGRYRLAVMQNASFVISAPYEEGSFRVHQYWNGKHFKHEADLLVTGTTDLHEINFPLITGMRLEGRVRYEDQTPAAGMRIFGVRTNSATGGPGNYSERYTDDEGYFSIVVPADQPATVSTDGMNLDSFYPRTYHNAPLFHLATFVSGAPGQTITGLNIDLEPGFRVQGNIISRRTGLPAAGVDVNATMRWLPRAWIESYLNTDEAGFFDFLVPANIPFRLSAVGADFSGQYYIAPPAPGPQGIAPMAFADAIGILGGDDDDDDGFYATTLEGQPRTVGVFDLALYHLDDDTDGDGLMDWEEDTVPDGRYVFGEDRSNFEVVDTDGDGHTDYEEVRILMTDPADPESNLRLEAVEVATAGEASGVRLTWPSVVGVVYHLSVCVDPAANPQEWIAVGDPITADSESTSVLLTGLSEMSVIRITVYGPDL